jgi:hypothetical protein
MTSRTCTPARGRNTLGCESRPLSPRPGPPTTARSPCVGSTTDWWRGDSKKCEPFHVEIGYWFWDPAHQLVMRGLTTPRGIGVLAGGTAEPDDAVIKVAAEAGSVTFGILSNP